MDHVSPALLIAAHGSRAPGWAEAVREFAEHVEQSPGVSTMFSAVEATFLEAVPPPIPQAVSRHLAAGAPKVLVAPLFLTASGHLSQDLPALLGLSSDERVLQRLRGEGQLPLSPGLPVEMLELGPLEDLLANNVARRLALHTTRPSEEAIVLCAYGSSIYTERWEVLLTKVRTRLMKAGFAYATHAYVGHVVGMSVEPTRQAVTKCGRMAGVRSVHVVPLLLGPSRLQEEVIGEACRMARDDEPTLTVRYRGDAILPDGDLAAHVSRVALRQIGVFPTVDRGAKA
ncbi:MAG: CbiX/SirB N-terminal domain-containing protein [Myxococcota bacterium]|nr:CbiX/SirB N-terminal domain-containing protein [Myxococcota bacterium]